MAPAIFFKIMEFFLDETLAMEKLKLDLSQNNVICGDCKDWLPFIPDNSIDLIYIDPPFFSNKNYEIVWGNGFELRSFGDRWKGGINHYIGWMRERLIHAHRALKPTGSILLHCDWHANHYLRILLDELFGYKNFINDFIWCYDVGGRSPKRFARKHDNILIYSKGKKYFFNREALKDYGTPRKTGKKSKGGKLGIDKDGRPYQDKKAKSGKYYRYFLDEKKIPEDWSFEINSIQSGDNERIGYKTQKPEKLLKLLLSFFSNKNDKILDFFGGGGTTAKVAYDLGRRFISGDISPVAVQVIKDRLKDAGCDKFIDCNPYLTKKEWRGVNGHKFAEKICEYMGWTVNHRKSGDGGIDGWANDTKTIPVQIKNSDVSVATIRDLAGVLSGGAYKSGIVVGWSFSRSCYEFVAKKARKSKIKIELKKAGEIVHPINNIDKARWKKLYSERVKEAKSSLESA